MTSGNARRWLAAVILAMAAIPDPAVARDEKAWDTASSVGAYGLAAVAVGVPLVKRDPYGALQAAGSMGAAELVTLGLKEAFPERRPDGSDRKSFPSGHTTLAFAAAATLWDRQGRSVGIPAGVVATFVGVARVEARKHHWYDCVAGAAIGAGAGFLITRHPSPKGVVVVPWGDSKGGGLMMAMRF